jgi:UDP-N-acetylglucosamine 2-epimerase (non-hydrolysing)
MQSKILCISGARPNFMKLAPLVRAMQENPAFDPVLVHTGQHYDDRMAGQFFRDLGMPLPAHNLEVGSGSHACQTAEIMKRFEPVLLSEQPRAVLVVGDVNSTVACALVAKKLLVPVIHVEAGLRSFDRSMPEEINRVVTDAISDLLLITEESGRSNLLAEGIAPHRIRFVGNLMIDSLRLNVETARQSAIAGQLGLNGRRFGLVTLHRPANVDDPSQLRGILGALAEIAKSCPLYFPVHPRTRARIESMQFSSGSGITLLEPLGYLDFLCLMSGSSIVLTDSGGIQEETTALGIPCLTLRNNTERPVTVDEGTNILAGTTPESILRAWEQMLANPKAGRVPKFWDGDAAGRCLTAIEEFFAALPD